MPAGGGSTVRRRWLHGSRRRRVDRSRRRWLDGAGWWWVDRAGWRRLDCAGWWWRVVQRRGGREQRSGRQRRIAPVGVAGLLDSPSFTAPATVRTWLESGGVDPRVVSMLDSVLAHHTIGVSNLEVLSSPVHVQSFDIVSVDGAPVGPDNFAARDLVTEIAAMDPTTRPDEIGTPWPIQSPGFSTGPASTNGLHLAFEMPGTNATPTQDAAYSGIDTGQPQPQ